MATINDLDKLTEWELNAGEHGYLFSDYNLNSQVSNQDKDNYWLPNVGYSSQFLRILFRLKTCYLATVLLK